MRQDEPGLELAASGREIQTRKGSTVDYLWVRLPDGVWREVSAKQNRMSP